MEQQLQQEIRWVQRMQKLAVPIWVTYVMALIAATLLTVESVGLLLGVVLATWSMTDTARSRFIQRKINACDPTMPTYDEVMERMS